MTNETSPTILPALAVRMLRTMSKSRLLVADDNLLSLAFFREALAPLDVDTVECADGGQALQLALGGAFDVLLLDARMPVMGGIDVLLRVRAESGPSRDAIALATTADNDSPARLALLAAGFAEVLVKPIRLDALRAAIGRHIVLRDMQDDQDTALDDRQSLAAAGGDRVIAVALRALLSAELEQLPTELAAISSRRDVPALLDRLHRLDASAGFCGVPALVAAGLRMRNALVNGWLDADIARFLATCHAVRERLVQTASAAIDHRTP